MSESSRKSATWHTPAITGALVAVIVFSLAWMFFSPAPEATQPRPPLMVFDPDRLMQDLSEPGQFEDPIVGRAQVLAAARQISEEIAERTGSIILNKKAALGAPETLDITDRVIEEARKRLAESEAPL